MAQLFFFFFISFGSLIFDDGQKVTHVVAVQVKPSTWWRSQSNAVILSETSSGNIHKTF